MRKLFVTLALLAAASLSACDSPKAPEGPPLPADKIAASQMGKGFTVGPMAAKQTAYVYFDAQCTHCAELWTSFKPLTNQVRVVWIPVGFLNGASVSQGSALLSAADPVKAMDAHEALLNTASRGMAASYPSDEQRAVISANTRLIQHVGGTSVPFIVARNATTGETVTQTGSLPPAQLRLFLGMAQ